MRQAEHLAKKVRPGPGHDIGRASERTARRAVDADLAALERQLGDMLGLRVKVSHGKGGGTVALHYSTLDQLDLICQRLSRRADLAASGAGGPGQGHQRLPQAPRRRPVGAASICRSSAGTRDAASASRSADQADKQPLDQRFILPEQGLAH